MTFDAEAVPAENPHHQKHDPGDRSRPSRPQTTQPPAEPSRRRSRLGAAGPFPQDPTACPTSTAPAPTVPTPLTRRYQAGQRTPLIE